MGLFFLMLFFFLLRKSNIFLNHNLNLLLLNSNMYERIIIYQNIIFNTDEYDDLK